MKKTLLVVAVLLATLFSNRADDDYGNYRNLTRKNRFYVGPIFHFNVTAEMKNLPAGANRGPSYDDGYVDNDSSDNAGGRTWNWGFSNTNQVLGASPNLQVELHGAESIRDGSSERLNQSMQYGFEVGYGRELRHWGNPDNPIVFGLEASFTASALDLDAHSTLTGTTPRTVDIYGFTSLLRPNVPLNGSFLGPVPPNPPIPLLDTNRVSSTISTETETTRQQAQIDGTYWGFRLGPFFEVPIRNGWSMQFGVGLATINADAKLSYAEAFTITGPGAPPPTRQDSQSKSDWLYGYYLEARAQFWINNVTAIFLGGQYQSISDLKLQAANKEATVKFGNTYGVVLGVLYTF
jgi:hypothetical protein